jgi:hypothetical protein
MLRYRDRQQGARVSGFATVKKPDKPETDYQHMIMVGIAIFAVATLAWTFVIFVIRLFE